jgi:hypothetical protein
MPHTLEKVQIVLRRKLESLGAFVWPEPESESEESEGSEEYDVSWTLKFRIKDITGKRPRDIDFTLVHFYDLDAFGEDWPEMEQVHTLIHTNGPLDPELVRETLMNPAKIDVYTNAEMLNFVWNDPQPEEDDTLRYFGTLDEYVDETESSSE